MKKILSVFIITILILSSLSFVGCSGESYSIELQVYCYTSTGNELRCNLTTSNSLLESNIGTYPFFRSAYSAKIIIKNNKDQIVYDYIIHKRRVEPNEYLEGLNMSYNIINGNDKELAQFDLNDMSISEEEIERYGYVMLEGKKGIHEIKYVTPTFQKYGIDKTSFELRLSVEDDSRPNTAYFKAKESLGVSLSQSKQHTGTYDIYHSNKKELQFDVYDQTTNELLIRNTLPNQSIAYRKIGEDYKWSQTQTTMCDGAGVYICSVRLCNMEDYKECEYRCLVVYSGS